MSVFHRNPLFAPMLAVVTGMIAEALLPGNPWSYWPACILIPVLAWVVRTRNCARQRMVVLALCFLAGGWWLSLHPLPHAPEINLSPSDRALVEGCIVSAPRTETERVRFVLSVSDAHRMQISIYPRPAEPPPVLSYGMRIQVVSRVRPPRNFGNPGAFDYERYLHRQQVFWLGSATGSASVTMLDGACGNPLLSAFHQLRTRLLDRLGQLFPNDPFTRHYLAANLFGEETGIPEEVLEDFRRAGIYHTLVISGQHVAILGAVAFFLVQWAPIPRWSRFLLVALACWAYTLISGYEVPAVRASVAVSLYLLGSLAYRRARPLNLLSAIALLFLLWDPGLLFDAGFQLSFGAVLLIAGIAAPLHQRILAPWAVASKNLPDVARDLRLPPGIASIRVELRLIARTLSLCTRIPALHYQRGLSLAIWALVSLGSLLLISTVVQVGLSPLLIELFHRTPVIGPFANVVIGPFLAILVPLAFIHTALPCEPVAWMLGLLSHAARDFAHWTAVAAPDPRIPTAPWWVLLLCAACVVAVIARCEPMLARTPRAPKPKKHPAAHPTQAKWSLPAEFALASAATASWALLLLHPFAPQIMRGHMELTMLDVGQGESLLVVGPNGGTALIDAGGLGGFSSASRLDTGEDIVAPYLWKRSIRHLDLLVLSHYDFDHAGGAPAILRAFRPRQLWVPAPPGEHELGQRITAVAREYGVPVVVKQAGDLMRLDEIDIAVLHPGKLTPTAGVSNESSLVLQLRYGNTNMLLTGDLGRREELQLITTGAVPRADILKVAHHGSRTSTSDAWVQMVQPSIAMISAGWLNPFRHPHPTVVDRLQQRSIAVWRTDRDGSLTLRTNGQRWEHAWPTDE